MGGGWGNYSNSGQVNFRHHKAGLGPGGGENTQERAWRFEGNVLVLEGSGPDKVRRRFTRASCRIRLLARRRSSARGSGRRTRSNGAAGTTTPEHLLLGEDGWFHATTLPAGRKGVPKVPAEQWTPQQYAAAYNGMSASRGTYNVQGTTFVRRHIADTDPNLEDKLSTGTFAQKGDTFTWTGTDAAGQKFSATYTRMKPFDVYAPFKEETES